MKLTFSKTALCLSAALAHAPAAMAAQPGSVGDAAFAPSSPDISLLLAENPMRQADPTLFVCGGKVSSGTPIAGNAAGGGNSGTIGLTGVPAGAEIIRAELYWNVLTNSDEASNTGRDIVFAGENISGTQIGFVAGLTPCFSQANTVAWKADVTPFVSGDGAYAVSGFPGGNLINGADFTEGVSLNVLYDDGSSTLRQFVNYEGLVVSHPAGATAVSQMMMGFTADPVGPVEATWYPVIGNGQISPEDLELSGTGAGSPLDLSDDLLLDGGTQAFAAGTCSYPDDAANTQCYWDDDMVDVSAVIGTASASMTMDYTLTNDCHSFSAMQLLVTTDQTQFGDFCDEGSVLVDELCPAEGPVGAGRPWANHGEYVSCVAHAANGYLVSENVYCDEVRSCIVNPRARSNVGRGGRP